jgi:SAM-dependent methyltransferase
MVTYVEMIKSKIQGAFNVLLNPKFHRSNSVYWDRYNVTFHKKFTTREESLEYLAWRNAQYPPFEELMPTKGWDGKVVLDYGCGPGHDVVGFAEFSNASKIYGMDISAASVAEARKRLQLHKHPHVEIIHLQEEENKIPLPDNSVDYIHSCGVIHHIENPVPILKEFNRILKKDGKVRLLLYNYDSIWLHLYVAYVRRIKFKQEQNQDLMVSFKRSTDGDFCPYSVPYKKDDLARFAEPAGFSAVLLGCSISLNELKTFEKMRWEAISNQRFPKLHRDFMGELKVDENGFPTYKGIVAGINAIYELKKTN